MKGVRGFSLIEAMLAMGLVFTILGLLATLMREYSAVTRHASAKDETLDTAFFALVEMRNDLSSSIRTLTPGAGADIDSQHTSLHFERMESRPDRYQIVEFEDDLPKWNPRNPEHRIRIRYRRDGSSETLLREATRFDGQAETSVMASKTAGFIVTKLGNRNYKLELTVKEEQRTKTLSIRGHVWSKREGS